MDPVWKGILAFVGGYLIVGVVVVISAVLHAIFFRGEKPPTPDDLPVVALMVVSWPFILMAIVQGN